MGISKRAGLPFFLIFFVLAGTSLAVNIGMIDLIGNYSITREEIMAAMAYCREGSNVTLGDIEQDIFNIKDMGYFQDVKYNITNYIGDTKILTLEVIEYPYIKEVTVKVEGPRLIDQKQLAQYLLVQTNKALNYKKLIRTMNSIKNHYTTEGFSMIEMKNNVQVIDGNMFVPDGKLTISVVEYGINDIVVIGELGDITYQEIFDTLKIRTFKAYYEDFWKFITIKDKCYPNTTELQMAF